MQMTYHFEESGRAENGSTDSEQGDEESNDIGAYARVQTSLDGVEQLFDVGRQFADFRPIIQLRLRKAFLFRHETVEEVQHQLLQFHVTLPFAFPIQFVDFVIHCTGGFFNGFSGNFPLRYRVCRRIQRLCRLIGTD